MCKRFIELLHHESLYQPQGGTNISNGLLYAYQELERLSCDISKRVILLTDGEADDETECRQFAHQYADASIPIVAIGIGIEYNEVLLRDIAEITQGRPYALQTTSQLGPILDAEIDSSVREVLIDMHGTILTVKGVEINSITRVYPNIAANNTSQMGYHLGNISGGDYTVFILELTVAGIARSAVRARLAQINLSGYSHTLARREAFPTQELIIPFSNNDPQLTEVNEEVTGYAQQKNIDYMMQEIAQQVSANKEQAREILTTAAIMTGRLNNETMTQVINEALEELHQTGTISRGTRKTIVLAGRTCTVKTAGHSEA